MESLATWLAALGLEHYATKFADQEIDLQAAALLTEQDLRELGIPLGPRRKLLHAIAQLSASGATVSTRQQPERRQLTVLFCDVVDWTVLSQNLDPELLRELTRAYQVAATEVIKRYDGHVAQYLGDGLLVYFGYPRAHEDDAERAIRAAMGVVSAIQALNAQWAISFGVRVSLRFGAHTGMVVVGEMGDDTRRELLALGEAPNIAARMQTLAEPNTIVISDRTRRLSMGVFDYADLGPRAIKGLAQPIQVWRVLGSSEASSRFDAATRSGLTPMINREQELQLLTDCGRQAEEGKGQVILVSGEAGVGKSRLIRALRERPELQTYGLMRFQCSAYHENTAFYPIAAGLELSANFAKDETPSGRLDKIEAFVAKRCRRPMKDVQLIASILSAEAEQRYGPLTLTPQRLKQETVRALLGLVSAVVSEQPCLVLFEDIHWADPSTLEVLGQMIPQVKRLPLLLVITQRGRYAPDWLNFTHVTALQLERLDRTHSAAMVAELTRGKALPAQLLEHVVMRTDGVPLFVEELTKALLESSALKEAGDRYDYLAATPVPSTLRDSLLARLERSPAGKSVAQIGAVIGREFSYQTMTAVATLPRADVDRGLEQLTAAGLVFTRDSATDPIYIFKHALVRDVAYESLVKNSRQRLHASIARVLTELKGKSESVHPELLAYHYAEAGLNAQAIHHWQEAGQEAAARSANIEAERHLRNALQLLPTIADAEHRTREELNVLLRLGPVLMASRGYAAKEVGEVYERALRQSQSTADGYEELSILRGFFHLLLTQARHEAAAERAERLLLLAKKQPAKIVLVDAYLGKGLAALYQGEFVQARDCLATGAQIYDGSEPQHAYATRLSVDLGVGCLSYQARVLWFLGFPDSALDHATRALTLARQTAKSLSLAQAMGMLAVVHQTRCEIQSARRWAEEVISYSNEQGHAYWSAFATVLRGWLLTEEGQIKLGLEEIERGIDAYRATGAGLGASWFLLLLAEGYQKDGRYDQALATLAQAWQQVEQTRERYYAAEILRRKAEVMLVIGGRDVDRQAQAALGQAIAIAAQQSAKSWQLRAACSLARLGARNGQSQPVRDQLAAIYNSFTEGYETQDLQQARELLRDLR